nr:major capsid protein [Enterococcus hirae]
MPNRTVADIVVRFVKGSTGLVDAAKFRAYDAEPEIGTRPSGKRVTLELPAVSQDIPVSEYEQLRQRSGAVSDAEALVTIQNTTDAVVQAVSDAVERLRGIVLATGKATISQDNFQQEDDFGRPAAHQLVATGAFWADKNVSRLDYLQLLSDVYTDTTGETPGSLVMSLRVFRAMAAGSEFQTQLVNGGARQPTQAEVNAIVTGAGLPEITLYNRRVSYNGTRTNVLPDDTLLMLPTPVAPDDFAGTDLGATFWGRTLTSTDADWGIADLDRPGIVTGVWKNDRPPMGLQVLSDAIALPVLANADRSLAAKVLA